MTKRIAILGASGYTGAELVRLIATHPEFQIVALTGERKAGQPMGSVFPFLRHLDLPDLCRIEEVNFAQVDLAFCALPHATSQAVIKDLPARVENRGPVRRFPAARSGSLRAMVWPSPCRARVAGRGRLWPDRVFTAMISAPRVW